jgi:hypothetical protein
MIKTKLHEISICWKIKGVTGNGEWHVATDKQFELFQLWVNRLNQRFGEKTHWVRQKTSTVWDINPPSNI